MDVTEGVRGRVERSQGRGCRWKEMSGRTLDRESVRFKIKVMESVP